MQLQNVSSDLKSLRRQSRSLNVRLQGLTTLNLGNTVFWDVTQSRLVDSLECFEVACVKFSEYSSILRMEATGSSKTWRSVYQTSRSHVAEYRNLQHGPTACQKKLPYVSDAFLQLRASWIIFPEKFRKFLVNKTFLLYLVSKNYFLYRIYVSRHLCNLVTKSWKLILREFYFWTTDLNKVLCHVHDSWQLVTKSTLIPISSPDKS